MRQESTGSELHCRVVLAAGPTAIGKSEIALLLAEKIGGEIVSVDSMQVYRGMDIGTAKPSAAERGRVAHHLIDVVGVKQPFDAAQFVRLAQTAIADIEGRGKIPILCGGTGLYFKALFEGLGQSPPGDAALRAELEATPLPRLLEELEQRDPFSYGRIDRQNLRRVIRAIEVIRLTGQPFSQQQSAWENNPSPARPEWLFGLERAAGDLHQRIEARVEAMFRGGLVGETQGLLDAGLGENKVASQALGYRQVIEHLQGVRSLAETVELVKIRTRQFAKRQMTWFRRKLRLRWVRLGPEDRAEATAGQLASLWKEFLCLKE